MECWAHINGKDYPIANGWTLSEEFSETLDSASIVLPHVIGSLSLKPYDDIIVHDYGEGQLPPRKYGVDFSKIAKADGHFYRHMLCYNFNKEKVTIDPFYSNGKKIRAYNYNIELMSETKGLETVQLPNRTITQPIGTDKDSSGANNPAPVRFEFGHQKYTLPYSCVNDWRNGLLVYETHIFLSPVWRRWFLFGGDVDAVTSDYMRFSSINQYVKPNTDVILPDWNVSGVTFVFGTTEFWKWYVQNSTTYHPKKHWIIRKLGGTQGGSWDTRDHIIADIETYINFPASRPNYPEIKNYEVCGKQDITSQEQISSNAAKFINNGDYEIYLYVEPEIVDVVGDELDVDDTPLVYGKINIFGMVDNSNGNQSPLQNGQDVSVPFLAEWDVTVTDSTNYSKSVVSVYEAARQAIELYSPRVKLCTGTKNVDGKDYPIWEYIRKYSLSDSVKSKFFSVNAPENQFNYPNLRDYLTRIFYSQDCIPVVRDNVIDFLDLSKRDPQPFYVPEKNQSFDQYMMDGSSYCDRLLRIYTDGLSRESVTNCIERIGFKNKNSSTLTLENMQLELSHPIYKINKVYMCYYNEFVETVDGQQVRKMALCKQDITPLILLNSQRQLLSRDWVDNVNTWPSSIEDLATYYFATIGYDIGSNVIGGWGTRYSHPKAVFWKTERTVIENIYAFMAKKYPYGVSAVNDAVATTDIDVEFSSNANEDREAQDGNGDDIQIGSAVIVSNNSTYSRFFGDFTQRLKSMVFIIEYEGFVSSSILASKEKHDGNVVSRDNASSSLSFVESDGINQKEKANRLGNATRMLPARHKSFWDIQNLASVWNDDSSVADNQDEITEEKEEEHVDEVCYKRIISFEKDYFSVTYYFCRNYILRNYFTSVYSKHRPFPLASYEESVDRQENKTLEVLFSAENWYYQEKSNTVAFNITESTQKLLSFFLASSFDTSGNIVLERGIDKAFYGVYPNDENRYKGQFGFFAVDLQKFTSGHSFCMTIPMIDNVSAGVFISNFNHNLGEFIGTSWEATWSVVQHGGVVSWMDAKSADETAVLLTGARQNWYMFPVDPNTGMLYSMRFCVGFSQNDVYGINELAPMSEYNIALAQLLPLMDSYVRLVNGEYNYFGKLFQESPDVYSALGAGYPRIEFIKDDSNKYKVDFIGVEGDGYTASECLIQGEIEHFHNANGDDVGDREEIHNFAEAIFNGHETETMEESPLCVFKDGKERITTTIQFEPVSEDVKIRFSEYMMRLSDVMGKKKKTYSDQTIEFKFVYAMNVANVVAFWYREESGGAIGDLSKFCATTVFSVPALSIGVPVQVLTYTSRVIINHTFELEGQNGWPVSYQLKLKSIEPLQLNGNGDYYLQADIDFHINGNLISSGNVILEDITGRLGETIEGIGGTSDFRIGSTCVYFSGGYKTFALVDDRVLFKNNFNDKFSYRYSNFPNNRTFAMDSSTTFANNSFVMGVYYDNLGDPLANVPTEPQYDFSDAKINFGEGNYTEVTIKQKDYFYSGAVNTETVGQHSEGEYEEKKISEGKIVIPRTMHWVFTNELMGIDTEYDVLSSLDSINAENLNLVPNTSVVIGSSNAGASNGMQYIDITLPSARTGTGSIRLYYLEDDGLYHFVFGVNVDKANPDYRRTDCVYPQQDGVTYRIYISFLDDRSRTVIDDMEGSKFRGDPIYRVADFAQDELPSGATEPFNMAMEK